MMKDKKGQEEMVGFVMIVIIVTVIVMIFLGFSVNKGQSVIKESVEIQQFLESSMQYTSSCDKYQSNYYQLGELMNACYSGERCASSDVLTCEVLNTTLTELLDNGFDVGQDKVIKGYVFISSINSSGKIERIVNISRGSCTGGIRGSETPSFGGVVSSLKLCY